MRMNRNLAIVSCVLVALALVWPAAAQVVQTPLNPKKIPQFVQPLPLLGPTGLPVVDGRVGFLSICEFQTQILPAGSLGKGTPAPWTWVWGYHKGQTCPQPNQVTGIVDGGHSYIGPVVLADRDIATQLTFINQLPNADPYGLWKNDPSIRKSKVLAYTQNTDQTMHWADPLHAEENHCSEDLAVTGLPPVLGTECAMNYSGPIAAAVHLHGGEVPPDLDGGPDSWFTGQPNPSDPNKDAYFRGHGFYTREVEVLPGGGDLDFPPGVLIKNRADGLYYINQDGTWTQTTTFDRATYVYPNKQEAANIWFHDHVLGFTRLNVYAGIAGAYVITDSEKVNPQLKDPKELIPVVIQDRMFDTIGQLYFAAGGTTPEHPYWVPEFIGDVIVVNGKAWPYLNVENKKYRFLFLNGSNARAYELYLNDIDNDQFGPDMWVIGTDGGFLDTPARIEANAIPPQKLVIMPGERYEVVIDFTKFANRRLQLWNTAKTPFPFGGPVGGSTTKRIMEIRVVADPALVDVTATSYDPVSSGSPRVTPIVPLGGLTADVKRQLTLNEVISPLSGTPLEALLNNTKWGGYRLDAAGTGLENIPGFQEVNVNGKPYYYSEVPEEGTYETWEIINITADAHPIHLHLVQFQILGRQPLDPVCYNAFYNTAFPGGLFIPGYGPPLDYFTENEPRPGESRGAIGGNPAPWPCFVGAEIPPGAFEAGWKDTVVTYPDQVTRLAVRWAPTDISNTETDITKLGYPFDPNHGHGYVWHCHILDHEDNEMMRPTQVWTNENFIGRSFEKGTNY